MREWPRGLWGGRVQTVHKYEPFDDMIVGDILHLGHHPRRVLEVRRSEKDDAVRVVLIDRLKGRGAPGQENTVVVFRADLKCPGGSYEFRGYWKQAMEDAAA